MAEGDIKLSKSDQFNYQIIERYRSGMIDRSKAALLLSVSQRTVARWAKQVREIGFKGIQHLNKGNTPKNKGDALLHQRVIALVEEKYFDFNVSHCREMLLANEGIKISYTTLHRLCKAKGLIKRKKRIRAGKHRAIRERMACEGLLLQMDGSFHKWNGKEEWCLIGAIDDATSEMAYAEFFKSEDTWNCMKVLEGILLRKGIPEALYVDKAGWSGGVKRIDFSQFKNAAESLGIQVIFANSPEAKGRIERAWRTFQDRLIPELRLHGITEMNAANTYLHSKFIPEYWNKHLVVLPRNLVCRYKPVPAYVDLAEILCKKEFRRLNSNKTILLKNSIYKIASQLACHRKGDVIEIRIYRNGNWAAFLGNQRLEVQKIMASSRKWVY